MPELIENTFGVELEISERSSIGSPERIASAIRHNMRRFGGEGEFSPVVVRAGNSGTVWDCKYDGSCGFEVTSPALRWDRAWHLDVVCGAIYREGGRADRTCGLHVHHYIPNLNNKQLRRIWLLWACFEPTIYAMLPPRRRQGAYSFPLRQLPNRANGSYSSAPEATWMEVRNLVWPVRRFQPVVERNSRYQGLNMTHWWRTGRIEVRVHHGTLRADDIKRWILFTQEFIHAAKNPVNYDHIQEIAEQPVREQLPELARLVCSRSDHEEVQNLPEHMAEFIARRNPALTQELITC